MKIGRFWFGIDRTVVKNLKQFDEVDEDYEKGLRQGKQLILCTAAARSGTRWLGDIFDAHENATGVCERDAGAESFYRYIKYNNLPIDTKGVLTLVKKGIVEDWEKGDISFVDSPYFSHGISELYARLRPARIIFGLNDPKFTVQSIYNKGLFMHTYYRDDNNLALGFQPALEHEWSHFFGRVVPNGDFYHTWLRMTRLGKISWWGNRLVTDIYEQLKQIPREKIFVFHLKEADQNYDYYQRLAKEFNLSPFLSEKKFLSLKGKTVRSHQNAEHEWSTKEREEFDRETKEWYGIYRKLCG